MIPTILYEDNHILVAEKPVNMPVQADSSKDEDLLTALKAYIKEKYAKPGEVYLALVHRLDRPVGGVMVFARTSKAAKRLSEQMATRQTDKRYIAIADGTPQLWARLDDHIKKDADAVRAIVSETPFDGAKTASLLYRRLAQENGTSLLHIQLLTGRKHQIRAQLAAHGCPIQNDQRYHDNAAPHRQIALWAVSLTITHPTLKIPMTFCSAPKGEVWRRYAKLLEALPVLHAALPVYADEQLLAVHKFAGYTVALADEAEPCAAGGSAAPEDTPLIPEAALPYYAAARDTVLERMLSAVYGTLYPVHRLDAGTQGLVLFARTEAAKAALEQAFAAHTIEKEYRAVVTGRLPKPEDVLEMYLRRDPGAGKSIVLEHPGRNALPIKTGYTVLAEEGGLSLLAIRLYTGRTHQIRAQFAYIGNPVLGDDLYGDRAANKLYRLYRQQLCACRILLHFPGNSVLSYLDGLELESPYPVTLP